MKKLLTLVPFLGFCFALFFIESNVSSCTKKTTEIVTDTVIKTVRDTVVNIDTVPVINLTQGLVAYYPFNGNANDSSGNNNNGTAYGNLQYTSDKSNKSNSAAQFDGLSSYILVNDNGSLSPNSMSISAQFYCGNYNHSNILSKIQFATADGAVFALSPFGGISPIPDDLAFAIRAPGAACGVSEGIQTQDLVFATETIQLNTWYQVTCVFDQGKESIYLNGVLRNAITRSFIVPKQCTQAQLVMGAWWQSDPFYFNGRLDELRIYNRALNYREIQQLATGF